MKILAFDIASRSTGYSVFNNGRLTKSACGIIKINPKASYGKRLLEFEVEIRAMIRFYKPDMVVIEDIFKGRSILVFKILSYFRGVAIKAIYEEMGKDPISIMATVARSLIGVKNQKEDVYKFIVKKYKLTAYTFEKDNDRTDAIALGLACHEMQKQGLTEKDLKKTKKRKRKK